MTGQSHDMTDETGLALSPAVCSGVNGRVGEN
jgi:hypothetical protein